MSWLADMPFQRKLRFAILFTAGMAVLLVCGAFLAFEYIGRERTLIRTISTIAQAAADNSTATIAFEDTQRALETLESLRAEPQVVAAVLLTREGREVASYRLTPDLPLPPLPAHTSGVEIAGDHVVGVVQVVEGSRWLGTLYVWASRDRFYDRMKAYSLVALIAMGASFILAWLLATLLKHTIAQPILELANTASAIAAGRQDYSLRARQYGTDELGRLTAAFNAMLDRTQAAVADLRASEAQLRIVTDNASVFLAHLDRDLRFKFVNRPYAQRFGLEPDAVIGRAIGEVVGVGEGGGGWFPT
jgi:methyl-accepting chemotaxis protein